MRINALTPYALLAALVGTLACAGGTARTDDEVEPEQAGAAQDTAAQDTLTAAQDTLRNPPGYRGMEQDTTLVPPQEQTPTDTFLQQQGQGTPQDTAGYGGLEKPDTTGQAEAQTDTTTMGGDTTGTTGQDTSGMTGDTTGMTGADTAPSGDTTGYDATQQPGDTTSR